MAPSAKTTSSTLPKEVFAVETPNHELLKLAYDAYLANGRRATATTKTRGEVRGGGKKPWRQKGTGRARFGSSRNPIWRGGGIVFGPRGVENYTKKLSKTAKHVALRQALTLANKAHKITLVDDVKATGKTHDMVTFLADHKADVRRVLLVVNEKTPELLRSTNNLQSVVLVRAQYLTVYHILNADKIVMTKDALGTVTKWLGA
ncbi:MAG TPA: 50S ribosomal protein L4 [Candidatus Saccharimonadales bacterium]